MRVAKVLIKMGVPVLRYMKPDLLRRIKIMNDLKIDLLFDIGANTGQYGEEIRTIKYKGDIVSFEPLNKAYAELEKVSKSDNNWKIEHYALGDSNSKNTINIAGNSVSSSILEMKEVHVKSAPTSGYIATQEIEVKKLDDVFHNFYKEGNKVMLKIDTQGFEKQVLDGAINVLDKVSLIQIEMSLISLYEGEMLYKEMIQFIESKGFKLISFENGFNDKVTGQLLQVDGIFANVNLA